MKTGTGFSVFAFVSALVLSIVALQPTTSRAQVLPTTATGFGSNFWVTSTLNPSPIIPVGGGTSVPQCPWINTALAQAGFVSSNGWNFTWAPSAAFVQPDLTINQYFAWATNEPTVTTPDGDNLVITSFPNSDSGGAILGLTYTPQAGNPTNVFFLQAYTESLNGGAIQTNLDNRGSATNPFYESAAGLGITNNPNASWFADDPYDNWQNPNGGPPGLSNSVVQFQTVIAVDNKVGTTNNVTIYGGDWWGYQFNVSNVPEPSTVTLVATGLGALAFIGTMRRRRRRT